MLYISIPKSLKHVYLGLVEYFLGLIKQGYNILYFLYNILKLHHLKFWGCGVMPQVSDCDLFCSIVKLRISKHEIMFGQDTIKNDMS